MGIAIRNLFLRKKIVKVMNEKDYKKRLEEAREFTKGIMPLGLVCKTEEEYKGMMKLKARMKNVKNLKILR